MALIKIGNIKGQKGDKGDQGPQGIVPPSIDKRLDAMEEIASEPGTRLENHVIDPIPALAADTWVGANATMQQATVTWGRAIVSGSAGSGAVSATSRGGLGAGEDSKARVYPGDKIAARIILRAMATQKMSATLNVIGYMWNGTDFVDRTTIATSGQLHIEPDASVTFTATSSLPANSTITHFELLFTFRRFNETYPAIGDWMYFRQAALYSGANAVEPVPYIDGNSADAFWTDQPNRSASIRLTARTSSGGTSSASAAHAVLLDDFTYRRGGPKMIGPKSSISFRIDHGLANFSSKMRAKLEALGFKYALALGSRDWGASENAGITAATVNGWVLGGFAEVWSHSIGHQDADTESKIRDYIINSRKELEAAIPAATVDGYMPPGAGGTRYMGFGPITTPQKFFDTIAGQVILENYAVSTGELPGTAYRVQDGHARVGQAYFNMDTFDTAGVMSRVNTAISQGKGIQLMIHPSLIDTPGHITTAQLHAVLDQIKALETSGKAVVMSAYDQMLADSTSVPGEAGPAGPGVPEGGNAFQLIRKNPAGTTTEWVTPTKTLVGLSNVDNTRDVDKPVSLDMQRELETKQPLIIEDPANPGYLLIGG